MKISSLHCFFLYLVTNTIMLEIDYNNAARLKVFLFFLFPLGSTNIGISILGNRGLIGRPICLF